MKLLNQSDPCVETTVLDTGELVLCTSGEVHLDRCIEDLKTRYLRTYCGFYNTNSTSIRWYNSGME